MGLLKSVKFIQERVRIRVFFAFEKTTKKHRFSDPPEPSRSSSRCSGSTVQACAPRPLKVLKNDPKTITLGRLWPPKARKRPSGRRRKSVQKTYRKKVTKKTPQKTCLSMEREARLINETLSIFMPHSHTNVHMHAG